MNRRHFLKSLSALTAVVSVPALAGHVTSLRPTRQQVSANVRWQTEYFDWGYQIGVAGYFELPGGIKYRNAVRFMTGSQNTLSDAKRALHNWIEAKTGSDVILIEQNEMTLPQTSRMTR